MLCIWHKKTQEKRMHKKNSFQHVVLFGENGLDINSVAQKLKKKLGNLTFSSLNRKKTLRKHFSRTQTKNKTFCVHSKIRHQFTDVNSPVQKGEENG